MTPKPPTLQDITCEIKLQRKLNSPHLLWRKQIGRYDGALEPTRSPPSIRSSGIRRPGDHRWPEMEANVTDRAVSSPNRAAALPDLVILRLLDGSPARPSLSQASAYPERKRMGMEREKSWGRPPVHSRDPRGRHCRCAGRKRRRAGGGHGAARSRRRGASRRRERERWEGRWNRRGRGFFSFSFFFLPLLGFWEKEIERTPSVPQNMTF